VKAYILSDGEFDTEQLRSLTALVKRDLVRRGYEITEKKLGKEELDYCRGCFGCWVKTPGECVIRDSMAEINRAAMASDVMIYLVPVVYGQFSANMKNAIDRWIPNILPLFIIKPNGDTMHPARYKQNPQYIMIGYGNDLADEDALLFMDITTKHRDNGVVMIYDGDDEKLMEALSAADLQKMGETL
jgi:multimeric flavodoxin WrbA